MIELLEFLNPFSGSASVEAIVGGPITAELKGMRIDEFRLGAQNVINLVGMPEVQAPASVPAPEAVSNVGRVAQTEAITPQAPVQPEVVAQSPELSGEEQARALAAAAYAAMPTAAPEVITPPKPGDEYILAH